MTHFSAAKRRLLTNENRHALGVPNFSCEAAFLLDAMAALPRKWVSDGAPTLPWKTITLPRALPFLSRLSLFAGDFLKRLGELLERAATNGSAEQ